MAYTSGDTILDDHYNTFAEGSASGPNHSVANINSVWGVGNGDKGYGQSSELSTVSVGDTVTATQWATLLNRMNSIKNHQGSTITAITNPTVGDQIEAFTALSSNITTIYNNRLNAAANGSDGSNNVSGTGSWTVETLHTIIVTFTSNDAARYFFNAGGELRFSFARSGGTSHAKNTEWTDLCNDSGTIIFGAQGTTASGQTGVNSVLASTIGYHDLTTSNQTLWKKFQDSSPYTSNYIDMRVSTNVVNGSGNGDKGRILTFLVRYRDDAAEDSLNDTVDGTITTTMVERPPSTTYLTDTWGNPTFGSTNSQS